MFRSAETRKQMVRKIDTPEFREALRRRGGGDLSVERVAKALIGKDRAGLTVRDMKHAVAALQDADLAKHVRTASEMVLTASREAQEHVPAFRTPQERAVFMQRLAKERRTEANAEEAAKTTEEGGTQGLLDRMRIQMRGRSLEEEEEEDRSDGDAPSSARTFLPLAPKTVIPRPPEGNPPHPDAGFQP